MKQLNGTKKFCKKNSKNKIKILIFGDLNNIIFRILTWHLLKLSKKNNIQIVKLFNTGKNNNLILNIVQFLLIKIFNPGNNNLIFNNTGFFLKYFSRLKIENIKSINEKKFVERIKKENYKYAFSFCCNQIFKKRLISAFSKVINYHSSILPKYKGLNSTLWSIFYNEKYTGFSYHYIDSKIDNGNIIFQKKFMINYNHSYKRIEIFKTLLAKNSMQKVLSLILLNFSGTKQKSEGNYYGKNDIKKLITFREIININKIKKIINIWGNIIFIKKNKKYFVTKISNSGQILRISHYPVFIYKILKSIKMNIEIFK
jgi:folate-dependent phosphoribosylglycinamide formyltransferase PurN